MVLKVITVCKTLFRTLHTPAR